MSIHFDTPQEMLDYLTIGEHDLYNTQTGTYVFGYNENGSICVYTLDQEHAVKLAKTAKKTDTCWAEHLGTHGSAIYDLPENKHWCTNNYASKFWIHSEDLPTFLKNEKDDLSKTPVIQICFTLKNLTIDKIRTKLNHTKERLDKQYPNGYLTKSCHLNRTICKEQGFTTEIPDLFEEIFGKDGYQCELTETTMAAAKENMELHRRNLSKEADNLVVLSETELTNVALEIELFTDNHLMII